MCTRYPIINRVSELKVHIELTRFVQPEKIEIDANERAVNEKSQYCFFVCTTFDSFLNGLFVDNQGTDAVYSSLITQQSWEGEDKAIISVYRLGEIEGSFIDNGNGNLDFTSDDGSIKGTIQINGWNGATFEVTETIGAVPFSVGEKFEFPFAF